MTLLYPSVLFLYIPLYFLYKQESFSKDKHKKRQKKLLYLTLILSLFALARPVLVNSLNEQKFDAKDYIIALDASFSMQADDLKPNRYEVAKQNIQNILKKSPKDRFSIFAFTTNAMLISPPTTDTQISILALNSLQPKYILTKGTSLLSLFKTITKTSYLKKNLIIFSDGGEDHDLPSLVAMCKKSSITPYIVATASNSGATLQKDDKPIVDAKKNLVISRINPMLESLAQECGGQYYLLQNQKDISDKILSDIKQQDSHIQSTTKVLSYTELYYLPLTIALLAFFISITKFNQLFVIIPILFIPYPSYALNLLDFYHLKQANKAYKTKNFSLSAKEYEKLSPSPQSYYNAAVANYKAKKYKKALELFTQIKTSKRQLKQKIYYNIANCAVRIKKYKKAIFYYKNSLALGFDDDALYNLTLLYKLKLKEQKNISDILPKKHSQQQKQNNKKDLSKKQKKKNKSSNSSSNQNSTQKSAGSGKNKKSKNQEKKSQITKEKNKPKYKLGYRAYELINKGYTHEKHPW